MSERSYEFDPCALDGSNKEEPVTLDSWKPSLKKKVIVQSEWRKNQIGDNFNQQPGLDELKKIYMFLNKKASDAEIMQTFGITAEMLVAIKKEKYDPVDGISLDNQSKIYKEFENLNKQLSKLKRMIDEMVNTMFTDKQSKDAFKEACKKPKPPKKAKKYENCEESEEFCEKNEEISED